MATITDPLSYEAFCSLLLIDQKIGGMGRFVPNAAQRHRMAQRSSRDLVRKHRQTGATTEECARDLWHFLTVPNAHVGVGVLEDYTKANTEAFCGIYDLMLRGLAASAGEHNVKRRSLGEWTRGDSWLRVACIDSERCVDAYRRGRPTTLTRVHLTEVAFWDYAAEIVPLLLENVPKSGEVAIQSTDNGPDSYFAKMVGNATTGGYPFKVIEMPGDFLDPDIRNSACPLPPTA